MNTKTFFCYVVLMTSSILSYGQNNDLSNLTKGLKKVSFLEYIKKAKKQLDLDKYPVYDLQGNTLSKEQQMQKMMSGENAMDMYFEKDDKLKLIVCRPAVKKEKAFLSGGITDEHKYADLSVTTIDGEKYDSTSLKGKVVVLNFWFVDCPPCRKEIPELNKLVKKYGKKDIVFLAIARDKKKRLTNFLSKNPFNYKMIANGGKLCEKYKIISFPTNVIIDRSGKVVYEEKGYAEYLITKFEKTLKKQF